jgi:hypothetical protein
VRAGRQSNAVVFLGAISVALVGCVASINEERIEGPARPAPNDRSVVVAQRRLVSAPDSAAHGQGADLAPAEVAECREVQVTAPMIRDVDVRRSFADDAQAKDAAVTTLMATGVGLMAYGANTLPCPQCFDVGTVQTAGYAMLGLAAIPIAFLLYNAVRVQDSHTIELAAPEERPGPWHACTAPSPAP